MPLRRVRKPFFGPIRLPSELLFEIDPVFRDRDGRKLRRWRFGDPVSGQIVEEIPHEEASPTEPTVPEPMTIPSSSVFGMPYTYGKSEPPPPMPEVPTVPIAFKPSQLKKGQWMPPIYRSGQGSARQFPFGVLFLVVAMSVLVGLFLGSR